MASGEATQVRDAVLKADRERHAMEAEIEALLSQLGPVGMKQPLVDGKCAICKMLS